MYNKGRDLSIPMMILVALGLLVGGLAFSFILFSFGYWLITLILWTFFTFALPFSWWYALGGGLIALILGLFILPGRININV